MDAPASRAAAVRVRMCVLQFCLDLSQDFGKRIRRGHWAEGSEKQEGEVRLKRKGRKRSALQGRADSVSLFLHACSFPRFVLLAPDDLWNPPSWNVIGPSTVHP